MKVRVVDGGRDLEAFIDLPYRLHAADPLWVPPLRMDTRALDARLARLAEDRTGVLAVVGILGSTEFGTLDPIDEIADAVSAELPISVLLLIVVAVVMTVIARKTRFGRYIFATGGNPDAAIQSGINVRRNTILTYVLASLAVAIAAFKEVRGLD